MCAELSPDAVLGPFPQNLIKTKAKQLSRQRGFLQGEEEDLRQELTVRLLAVLRRFDPDRGDLDAFMNCVVETATGMIARERSRLKRGGGAQPVSLDQPASSHSGQGPTLASQLTPLDLGRRLGLVPAEPISHETVQAAVASLSPEDQAVCRELMTGTLSSASRSLAISRRQVRNAIDRIRRAFENAGFAD